GLEAKAAICERALDVLVGIYGAEAGNLALKMLATGGLFISGGVAAKLLPKLRGPRFLDAFTAKGRMKPLLESIPVKVIINDRVGLLGAARYALTKRAENASPVLASSAKTMAEPIPPIPSRKPQDVIVAEDAAALCRAAADEFNRCARAAIAERGRFAVALSGGNTPRSVYSLLGPEYSALPWEKTFIFF